MSTAIFKDESDLKFDHRGYSYLQPLDVEQAQRERCEFICTLPYLGFVRAHGAEAVEFLHAQLTNDLKHLREHRSQLSGYCTPKGRLLCIFRIHHDGDDMLLQAHREIITPTIERLRKYIMRSRVELKIDREIVSFGVTGKESSAELEKIVGRLPIEQNQCSSDQGVTIICHSAQTPLRYQVIGAVAELEPLWRKMGEILPKLGSWAWASMDINYGLATVYTETSEQFIPQMVNMDLTDAVSFDKGCYPGQEIVARMHYLGTLKTRMILGNVNVPSSPVPGDKVYAVAQEQSIGMVVDAMPGNDGYDILATARLENVERNELCLRNGTDYPIKLGRLPYPLHNPEQKQA